MEWEYKVVVRRQDPDTYAHYWCDGDSQRVEDLKALSVEDALNRLGRLGWELVAHQPTRWYCFRRPK